MCRTMTSILLFLWSGLSLASTVKVSGVDASTYLVSDQGEAYEAKNLTDGKQETAWIEGEDGSGLGSWFKLDLDGTRSITGFKIWNGYWITHDFWSRHNRAQEIEVEFSDGTKELFTLKDEMIPETVKFSKAVSTSTLKVRIKSVYRGSTFNDSGFSEVQVLDALPDAHLAVVGYTTSTTLAADGDGNYEPVNLADGIIDSLWCEGNADGDGVGEWVEVDFGGSRSVSKLKVRNGSAGSFTAFMSANRVKKATLTFSNGNKQTIDIKASMVEQTISFMPQQSVSVRITIDEVVKGTRYNDLCLSEAKFLP